MEVVLNKLDIENLIKNYYNNIEEIVFEPVEFKVTLKIDGIKPIEQLIKSKVQEVKRPVQPAKPALPKIVVEAKKGVMASGGVSRLMKNF